MTVPYVLDSSAPHYKHYYSNQAGNGLSVFRGKTIQNGSGIGSVFSKVFRGIAPVLKQAVKAGGKQLLRSGSKIVSDVVDGKSFSQSTRKNLSQGGKELLKSLSSTISPKVGGTKRKMKPKSRRSVKTKKRRLNSDIFS